ncbi:MAG: OmpH family outer membrane protein [Bacteroidales bacterium]|jgi:outer membrane protein|nr:OmpH family outer membrane protein [Bacteroidales bacterium]
MKKITTLILIALSFSAFSQIKLGHINSGDLMRMMPELDSADQQLQKYVKDYEEEALTIQTELQNKYNDFQANQNQYSDLIKQTKFKALQDLEARLQEYQQNAEKDLQDQRAKLFNPIMDKAKVAIEEVAKENKYTYIFDTTGGVLLYSTESDDITPLVKKKLNLK